MHVDLYTKSVLTVIALCLVWLCVRNQPVAPLAYAQGSPSGGYEHVVIGGWVGADGVIRSCPAGTGKTGPLPVSR